MRRKFHILIVLFCAFATFSYAKDEVDCRSLHFLGAPIHEPVDFSVRDVYAYRDKMLFLGDSDVGAGRAEQVLSWFPDATIVKTDYKITKTDVYNGGKFISQHMDNTKRFPFHDNEFDGIFMERGLCFCSGGETSCGGIIKSSHCMLNFLTEVARVLDKTYSRSRAVLQGSYGNDERAIEKWNKAARELMKSDPRLQLRMFTRGEEKRFDAIEITIAKTTNPE